MRPADEVVRLGLLERGTLVLNRSWRPIHVTTVRRALCLVFRQIARIIAPGTLATYSFAEWIEEPIPPGVLAIRSPSVSMAPPEVIVLARYNRMPSHDAPFTRRNLFLRDDFTCQYCGRKCSSDRLSVDHVMPRSRGGRTSWENCVLACVGCNTKKADRTLIEAGFRLLRPPKRPRWSPCLSLRPNQRLACWDQFTARQRVGS